MSDDTKELNRIIQMKSLDVLLEIDKLIEQHESGECPQVLRVIKNNVPVRLIKAEKK